jgi:hypothetical protein
VRPTRTLVSVPTSLSPVNLCTWIKGNIICAPLSITNEMQRYAIFFIIVNALHVSGGFSTHRQELKTVHTETGMCQACLLLPLAWVIWDSSTLAVAASKLDIYQMLCVQF